MVGYDCISVNASHTISIGALIAVLIGIENCKRSSSGMVMVERDKFRDTRVAMAIAAGRRREESSKATADTTASVSNPHEAQEYERCLLPATEASRLCQLPIC